MGFADPLFVKNIYGSSDKTFKAYVCLYTCATSRNVLLELTPNLEVNDVVKCLKCFISRGGCIKWFIRDNFSSLSSEFVTKFVAY